MDRGGRDPARGGRRRRSHSTRHPRCVAPPVAAGARASCICIRNIPPCFQHLQADPTIPPIDQTTMRFFNRVAVDDVVSTGWGSDDEAERLPGTIGNHSVLMMGQHGILTIGRSASAAMLMTRFSITNVRRKPMSTPCKPGAGAECRQPLDVAEKTARQWADYADAAVTLHLAAIREVLDIGKSRTTSTDTPGRAWPDASGPAASDVARHPRADRGRQARGASSI